MKSCRSRAGPRGATGRCVGLFSGCWGAMGVFGARDGGGHNQMYKRGRVSTLHAECRPEQALPFSEPQFPPFLAESPRYAEAAPCWKSVLLALPGLSPAPAPLPPTILLGSSCGNSEWGRRFGGALGAAFPLRDCPRGASGRRMFPRQPGDSAWQPPASLRRDRGRPAPAPNAPKRGR